MPASPSCSERSCPRRFPSTVAFVTDDDWDLWLLTLFFLMQRRGGLTALQTGCNNEISDACFAILQRTFLSPTVSQHRGLRNGRRLGLVALDTLLFDAAPWRFDGPADGVQQRDFRCLLRHLAANVLVPDGFPAPWPS